VRNIHTVVRGFQATNLAELVEEIHQGEYEVATEWSGFRVRVIHTDMSVNRWVYEDESSQWRYDALVIFECVEGR
jgi:hypothetical protein